MGNNIKILFCFQTNTGQSIPTICGANTGQHSKFYLELKYYIFCSGTNAVR